MAQTYPTAKIIGTIVQQDNSGNYIAVEPTTWHIWRIGKHTGGKFKSVGQIFLTENNLMAVVVATEPLKFQKRHDYSPMGRFLTDRMAPEPLQELLGKYSI